MLPPFGSLTCRACASIPVRDKWPVGLATHPSQGVRLGPRGSLLPQPCGPPRRAGRGWAVPGQVASAPSESPIVPTLRQPPGLFWGPWYTTSSAPRSNMNTRTDIEIHNLRTQTDPPMDDERRTAGQGSPGRPRPQPLFTHPAGQSHRHIHGHRGTYTHTQTDGSCDQGCGPQEGDLGFGLGLGRDDAMMHPPPPVVRLRFTSHGVWGAPSGS